MLLDTRVRHTQDHDTDDCLIIDILARLLLVLAHLSLKGFYASNQVSLELVSEDLQEKADVPCLQSGVVLQIKLSVRLQALILSRVVQLIQRPIPAQHDKDVVQWISLALRGRGLCSIAAVPNFHTLPAKSGIVYPELLSRSATQSSSR